MTNYICRNSMSPRQRFVTPNEGGEDKNALENMVAAIKEHLMLTNRMLQWLGEYGARNGNGNRNGNGHGATNGDVPCLNPYFLGLTEFKKMQAPPFRGEYDPTIAESYLMLVEKIFEAMACTYE